MSLADLERQFNKKVDQGQGFLRRNAWLLIGGAVLVIAALVYFGLLR